MKNKIEFNGKSYEVKEPTITDWSNVMRYKDILDEEEMYYKILEEFTGMSRDEILSHNAADIIRVGDAVQQIMLHENKKLNTSIKHKDKTYLLVDVNRISFGQFVDIDTFLRKDEKYRILNLNELAAYMYCEEGVEYGVSDYKGRIEAFKDLPVKHVESALFFLANLAEASQNLTQLYSKSRLLWKIMKIRIALMIIGDGITQLVHSQKTKFGRLIMWLISPLLGLSIISVTLWTSIKKKRKK
jgi:hypothetical protein